MDTGSSAETGPGHGRLEAIGPYELVREIGRGGQGVVYLAEDTRLRRRFFPWASCSTSA